jgi:ATP-dependent helicase/nuclease subunit B
MSKMPEIKFIGWDRPLLDLVMEHLLSNFSSAGILDLSKKIIVLPSRSAARRLEELLVAAIRQHNLRYFPGRFITPGSLPEILIDDVKLGSIRNIQLNDLQQNWLLAEAIQATPIAVLEACGLAWCKDDITTAYAEARSLSLLFLEIFSAGITLEQLAQSIREYLPFDDSERWEALVTIINSYQQELQKRNLRDRDFYRLSAIEQQAVRSDLELIICGCADLSNLAIKILELGSSHKEILVCAPEQRASSFDPFGRVLPEKWQQARVDLNSNQVVFALSLADEVSIVDHWIQAAPTTDNLVVGVASTELELAFAGRGQDSKFRLAAGRAVTSHRLYLLLEGLKNYAKVANFENFAALVRHTDLLNWFKKNHNLDHASIDLVLEADLFQSQRFPLEAPDLVFESDSKGQVLLDLKQDLDRLVEKVCHQAQTVEQFISALRIIIIEIYGSEFDLTVLGADQFIPRGFQEVADLASKFESLAMVTTQVSGTLALEIFVSELSQIKVENISDPSKVEVLGWLELLFDDRQHLFLTGMNENNLPESLNQDILLPDSVRQHLGLVDNSRRFARDNYIFHALEASREIIVSCSKYSRENKVLLPSRLILGTNRAELPQKLKSFLHQAINTAAQSAQKTNLISKLFELPAPARLVEGPSNASASSLSDYLNCPYRFYLKNILYLNNRDDLAVEMDGASFGNLLHKTLGEFGNSKIKDSQSASEIYRWLESKLSQIIRATLATPRLPGVDIQIEHLLMRFKAFADIQAEWASAGWLIKEVEKPFKETEVSIEIASKTFGLRGRIDRIDYNPYQKKWAIIDYKSSDKVEKAVKQHFSGSKWKQLQLPLYYLALRQRGIAEDIELGYCLLPQAVGESAFDVHSWDAQLLFEAEQKIVEVCQLIHDQVFWPPTEKNFTFDQFAFVNPGAELL